MPNLEAVSFFMVFGGRSLLAFISAMGPPRVVMACTKASQTIPFVPFVLRVAKQFVWEKDAERHYLWKRIFKNVM